VRCAHVTPIQDGILDAIDGAPVPVTPAQLTNYLPPAAWGYERLWRWQALSLLSGKRFPLREELKLVVGLMDPQRGGLLIDVACSNGLYARAFALAAPTAVVAGIDHSRPMLEEARRYARRAGLAISFVRASAQSLPFASGTVAGYGMGGSLNEIGDIDAALVEARRLLADDGRLVTMNLLAAERGWGRLPQRLLATGGITFPEQASLNRQFERAGLCPVAQWRWRVVEISLLLPQPLTPNP
jgi:SAM-dependent methyltransferase